MQVSESFYLIMRHHMNVNHYNQRDLSRLTLVHKNTINDWYTGKRLPSLEKCELLAKVFNVTLAELLKGLPKKAQLNHIDGRANEWPKNRRG